MFVPEAWAGLRPVGYAYDANEASPRMRCDTLRIGEYNLPHYISLFCLKWPRI